MLGEKGKHNGENRKGEDKILKKKRVRRIMVAWVVREGRADGG